MPLDRNATLKNAEKLLGEGQLAEAIEEYVRLADDLYAEGFIPKAAALYKKTLKIKADHEHALERLVDITESQGLMVDAKAFLRELSKQRHQREDVVGLAQCLIRVARLPGGESEARRIREMLGLPEPQQQTPPEPAPKQQPRQKKPDPVPVPAAVEAAVEEIQVEASVSEQTLEDAQSETEPAVTQALEPPIPVDADKDEGEKSIETVFGEMRSRAAHDRRAVLYDVADALEQRGDCGRALEIFMQVQSDDGAYRDVAERVERLRVQQQGSAGA